MLPNQQHQIYLHEGLIPVAAHPFRSPNGSSTAGSVSQISKTCSVVSSFIAPISSNGLHCKVFLIREKGLSHIWPCLGCMENDEPTKCGVRLKTAAKLGRVRLKPWDETSLTQGSCRGLWFKFPGTTDTTLLLPTGQSSICCHQLMHFGYRFIISNR